MRRNSLDTIRENLRLQKVYNTFLRYGMDMLFDRGGLGIIRRSMQTWIYRPKRPLVPLSLPVKVRLMIEELGPIYVKMGQMISSQAQALPPEWGDEFVKLQSNVPPFPLDEVRAIITSELGAPPEDVYAYFSPTPLAAASTAQVHRATLPDGQEVVVKIQRPNINTQARADLGIMNNAVRVVQRRSVYARDIDLVGVLNEFGDNIMLELDYRNEAYNAERLRRCLGDLPKVHVPTIYDDYSSSRILTMEFIQGVKLNKMAEIEAAGLDKELLAEVVLRSMIKQLLIDGFFHADPHPGNLVVNTETGVVTYLDTGMVGELDLRQRMAIISLIATLNQNDTAGLAQVMRGLSTSFRQVNNQAYKRDFVRRVSRFIETDKKIPLSESINAILDVLRTNGLRLDSQLTLALKALMQADAITQLLFPRPDEFVPKAYEYVQELAMEQVTADNITRIVTKEGSHLLLELMQQLPIFQKATGKWLDQYQRGRFELHLDTSDLNQQLKTSRSLGRQIIVGLILVGMIIGSAIATGVSTLRGDFWSLLPRVAFIGYVGSMVIAAVFVLVLLWRLLWGESSE